MLFRRALLAAIAILPLALGLGAAAAAINPGQAGTFIQKLGDEAIATLGKREIDKQTREKEFRRLLKKGFAVEGIARFVLGRFWRGASDEQRQHYLKVFEDYLVATYAARFGQYKDQTFKVSGERPDGADGSLVESQVEPKDGPPVVVYWRVREAPDGLKIVDVLVEGVSMAITQRSEFAAFIHSNASGIDGLIQELERKTATLR